jgi:hypothetical protein
MLIIRTLFLTLVVLTLSACQHAPVTGPNGHFFADEYNTDDHISLETYKGKDFATIYCEREPARGFLNFVEAGLMVGFADDRSIMSKNYFINARVAPAVRTLYFVYREAGRYTPEIILKNINLEPSHKYYARYLINQSKITVWLEDEKGAVIAGINPNSVPTPKSL